MPGHLIHLELSGRVLQQCNGREYELHPGAAIWYHEDKWVTGEVLEPPWEFYSVNFIAPCLAPPSFEARFFPAVDPTLPDRFANLYQAWHDSQSPAAIREFRVHAALLEILALLPHPAEQPVQVDPRARQALHEPVTLQSMQTWTHRSPATIARACQYAVGQPPLQRLNHVRLSLARGLVRSSNLPMKEIASRVGYARVHEFSRAYHRHFGVAPTADRGHTLHP